MTNLTFFENVEELCQLTGSTVSALWSAGFDTEDMAFGFVSDKELTDEWWKGNAPYYEVWLLNHIEEYRGGASDYRVYQGKHYYLFYI
jgi:hypothetical protein